MKYEGAIYGVGRNHNGRKIYFDTGRTSREWDAMEAKIEKLERENAALRERLEILSKSNKKQTEEYICVDREHGLWKAVAIDAARKEAQS